MSDEPDNMVLPLLHRIHEQNDRILDEIADLKGRVTSVERQLAALTVMLGEARGDIAGLSGRMDRLEARVGRIERRLDLVDVP